MKCCNVEVATVEYKTLNLALMPPFPRDYDLIFYLLRNMLRVYMKFLTAEVRLKQSTA